MRILFVSNGFPPVSNAGVESHTYALARELHKAGVEVHIFCRDSAPTAPMYTVRHDTVDDLPVTRVVNNLLDVYAFEQLYRNPQIDRLFAQTLHEVQPDIVHIQHGAGLSVGCLEQAIAAGLPTIVTIHDYWYLCPTFHLRLPNLSPCAGSHHNVNCFNCVSLLPREAATVTKIPFYTHMHRAVPAPIRQRLLNLLNSVQKRQHQTQPHRPIIEQRVETMRTLLGSAELILSPSHHLKNRYVEFGVDSQQIQVVPLGMNTERWEAVKRPPRPADAPLRFGYVGSILPIKGVEVAVRAFQQVLGAMTLDVIGFEPPASDFPAHIKALAATDPRIRYVGTVPNEQLPDWFATWDALLMPPLWEETFSFVAREALLTGLPVIASDMPVLPEIVRPGQNGFLLPAGDVAAWAAQIQSLYSDPHQLFALDPRADTSFARSFADHAAEQRAIYEEVLARRGVKP